MQRSPLFILILSFLVLFIGVPAYAWQGRMAGMGDPYGLVVDESDFLIHPAKIANGKGINFYGDYRFTYTGVLKWDNEVDIFSPNGTPLAFYPYKTSGDEMRHEALVGSSFPLGPGRMGLFFTYTGTRGNYDGNLDEVYPPNPLPTYFDMYDLKSDLDNFALRLLYGLPLGGFKLGGEVQFAYRKEEKRALFNFDIMGGGPYSLYKNYFMGGIGGTAAIQNTFPFMIPFDSRYWEALFKGSLDGKVGPLDLEFTLRGGFLFGGNNYYEYERQDPNGTPTHGFNLKGDVTGWQIGGDLWARYPLANGLTLPFLLRMDYQKKTRDGDGEGQLGYTGFSFEYKNQERNLGITVGGGVDKELAKGARIAAGIYYNYFQGKNDIVFNDVLPPSIGGWEINDYSYPDSIEHQVMLRLAGELELTPAVTLRMGLAPFYGWVKENFKSSWISSSGMGYTDDVPTDGYHWGIKASIGGTIKFKPITLEPFINGGYQQLHLKGDGDRTGWGGVPSYLFEMSKDRNEWSIGGGFSIKFN